MKKVLATLLTIVLLLTGLPFGTMKANAAGYNATAAVDYAKKYWDNGVGLCAEFVSNCLAAGGCNAWSVWVRDLRSELAYGGWGIEYVLKSNGGKVYKSDNSGKIAAGDPILFWCKKCNSWMHAAICGGFDSRGVARAYGHNLAWNSIDNFATYIDAHGHSGSNIIVYSVRMNSSQRSLGNTDPNYHTIPTRSLSLTNPKMVGSDVSWMQASLKKLGYSVGIDGEYGAKTEAVVKQFQKDYGLTVDGVCGAKTRAKLQTLLGCNHSYTAATCTEPKTCSKCGNTVGNALGHQYGSYVYNNDATTQKDGTKTRTCAVCKKTETITATGTKLQNPFVDVAKGQYYTEPVLWAVGKKITTGTSTTTFSPDAVCTRGQIVTFLWRAAGKPEPQSGRNPFVDVSSDQYYYKAVLWAVEKGITTGMDATHFAPDASCTRGQIVTFLWRAKGKPSAGSSNPFYDVGGSAYYHNPVLWAVKNGITTGMSATSFAPDAPCTRAQIVTFLYRAYK